MRLIVDASVALKWFLTNEPDAARALAILGSSMALIAPDVVIAEVCNAAWKSARLGRIADIQVDAIAASLPHYFATLVAAPVLAPRAVAIARELDHPVYDALYLALAEQEGATLVTAEARLQGKVHGTSWGHRVMVLAEYRIDA